jgi:hypothetical protein
MLEVNEHIPIAIPGNKLADHITQTKLAHHITQTKLTGAT